jgi:hypothetical protein
MSDDTKLIFSLDMVSSLEVLVVRTGTANIGSVLVGLTRAGVTVEAPSKLL